MAVTADAMMATMVQVLQQNAALLQKLESGSTKADAAIEAAAKDNSKNNRREDLDGRVLSSVEKFAGGEPEWGEWKLWAREAWR